MTTKRAGSGKGFWHLLPALLVLVLVVASRASAAPPTAEEMQKVFGSPDEAVQALVAALKKDDLVELGRILGPGSEPLVISGDVVADRAGRAEFVSLYEEKNGIDLVQPGKAVLTVGNQDYPVPIPLVKKGSGWVFDTSAGKEELINRRIGRNELKAIEVAHAYVDAQREYAARVRDARPAQFAQKLLSSPGKKDGLFWHAKEGEEESPMGPLVAQAEREGYRTALEERPIPFHGYYFRILRGQGRHAPGGAFNYVVNGRMALGFALVAYPAQYGVSGIMTFIVNQEGVVYQKDLGKDTGKVAGAIKRYDPDPGWQEVGSDEGTLPEVTDLDSKDAGAAVR